MTTTSSGFLIGGRYELQLDDGEHQTTLTGEYVGPMFAWTGGERGVEVLTHHVFATQGRRLKGARPDEIAAARVL